MILKNKEWWGAAFVRCIKTFCQAMIAVLGTQLVLTDFTWERVVTALATSAVAAVLSLITSLAGLPEIEKQDQDLDQE